MKNLIEVVRFKFNKDWTLSKYFINGLLNGFGVEDEIRTVKVKGETAVPAGEYELGLRVSPKFSKDFFWSNKLQRLIHKSTFATLKDKGDYKEHELIWVMNVPQFDFILIHWGNTDDDTDGCYIVGSAIGVVNNQEGVVDSRNNYIKMYTKAYPILKAAKEKYSIKYVNEKN